MKGIALNTNQTGRKNRPVVAHGFSALTTAAGIVTKRTRPMTEARAKAFAKCLAGNRHFADATVHRMSAGSKRFYVCYLPSNPERADDVFAAFIQLQAERAAAEMHLYDFKRYEGQGGGWLVKSLPDADMHRSTYHVTADGECNCPHYKYRLRKAAAPCKHIIAVASCCSEPEPPRVYAPAHNPVNPWGGWEEAVERATLQAPELPRYNTTGATMRLSNMTPAEKQAQISKDFD